MKKQRRETETSRIIAILQRLSDSNLHILYIAALALDGYE